MNDTHNTTTTAAQHTAGPWMILTKADEKGTPTQYWIAKPGTFPRIALLNAVDAMGAETGLLQEANARLIASAPDLLAALNGNADMLKEAARMHRLKGDIGHARMCELHEMKARAAIAKATNATA